MMTEIFRTDWKEIGVKVDQVNWCVMNPNAVTDWHMHDNQTDHLIAVDGTIKLALWDGRKTSPSFGMHDIIRFGIVRPVLVIVPPGVWHGLRNESGSPAGYINVTNELFSHGSPDNYRLEPDDNSIPRIL